MIRGEKGGRVKSRNIYKGPMDKDNGWGALKWVRLAMKWVRVTLFYGKKQFHS